MIEVIPEELLSADKVSEVILFLRNLGVSPRLKKETFLQWGHVVSLELTQIMFQELLGEFYDQT